MDKRDFLCTELTSQIIDREGDLCVELRLPFFLQIRQKNLESMVNSMQVISFVQQKEIRHNHIKLLLHEFNV